MPQTRKRKVKDSAENCKDFDNFMSNKKVNKANTRSSVKASETSKQLHEIKSKEIISNEVLKHSNTNLKGSSKRVSKGKQRDDKSSVKSVDSKNEYKISSKRASTPNENNKTKRAKVILKDIKKETESVFNTSDSDILSRTINEANDILPSCSNEFKNKQENETSSESEWEEVEDHENVNLDDYKPEIPEEGVEITIDCPELQIRKRKKKKFDENEWIRLYINRSRKDAQLCVHKVHLLCLFAHGLYVNNLLNSDELKALALSIIPCDILAFTSGKKIDKVDCDGIEKIVNWFCDSFSFKKDKGNFVNIISSLMQGFETHVVSSESEYNLIFVIIARALGFKVRFCISLYPVTHKAQNLIKKPSGKRNSHKVESKGVVDKIEKKAKPDKSHELSNNSSKKPKKPKISKEFSAGERDTKNVKPVSRPRRSESKNYKFSSDENDDSNDKGFDDNSDDKGSDETHSKNKRNSKQKSCSIKTSSKKSNRKVLSSDSESPSSPMHSENVQKGVVCWIEIFSKTDKQWICIECVNKIINNPYDIESVLPKPVSYILAFDNNSHVKDITRKYCNQYLTINVKLRVDPEWWEETLEPFLPPNTKLDKEEEKRLDQMLVNKPLPHTISEFKNHPLYALKRHLLKFEAIYPPDAPPVGFMRGEPIYARDCVHQLHSRETWLKEARVVRIGEEPYKIVKARPKWDKIAGVLRTDLPLEVFGFWQTEQYEPPIAVNGKVPRNEYGNVELFKSCMLPKGTVHLQLPGLNRIAKKLNIDCSPAVVGFDGHKGSVHPVFDGFIICEEFKDTIIAAWDEEQENIRKRETEKREKRIYGNWKKLIKGLLIRERIKMKYETS